MNSETNSKDKSRKKPKESNFWYNFVKITGALPALILTRIKIYLHGKSSSNHIKGGALIVSNHVTFIDPVTIFCTFWTRRPRILATTELYSNKFTKFFFKQMHCIEVDKGNFSIQSMHKVTTNLKNGKTVVIFPEGTVNHTDTSAPLLAFKSGAVLMAHRAGAPIIPLYIAKRTKWYQRHRVVVGEPIDIKEILGERPSMDALQRASDIVRERELELIQYYNSKMNARKKNEKK